MSFVNENKDYMIKGIFVIFLVVLTGFLVAVVQEIPRYTPSDDIDEQLIYTHYTNNVSEYNIDCYCLNNTDLMLESDEYYVRLGNDYYYNTYDYGDSFNYDEVFNNYTGLQKFNTTISASNSLNTYHNFENLVTNDTIIQIGVYNFGNIYWANIYIMNLISDSLNISQVYDEVSEQDDYSQAFYFQGNQFLILSDSFDGGVLNETIEFTNYTIFQYEFYNDSHSIVKLFNSTEDLLLDSGLFETSYIGNITDRYLYGFTMSVLAEDYNTTKYSSVSGYDFNQNSNFYNFSVNDWLFKEIESRYPLNSRVRLFTEENYISDFEFVLDSNSATQTNYFEVECNGVKQYNQTSFTTGGFRDFNITIVSYSLYENFSLIFNLTIDYRFQSVLGEVSVNFVPPIMIFTIVLAVIYVILQKRNELM